MITKLLPRQLSLGAFVLMVLMAGTRFHHFGSVAALPDASIAVFFLAGLWFGGATLFIALVIEAGLIDYLAITQFGVSDYCISPAYLFLIPSYAVVWLGGRFSTGFPRLSFSHLTIKLMILAMSILIAFLISNGSFFLLSDKITDPSWTGHTASFIRYFPHYLQYSSIYVIAIYLLSQLFGQPGFLNAKRELS